MAIYVKRVKGRCDDCVFFMEDQHPNCAILNSPLKTDNCKYWCIDDTNWRILVHYCFQWADMEEINQIKIKRGIK